MVRFPALTARQIRRIISRRLLRPLRQNRRQMARAFAEIYRCNLWGDPESHSGPGSSMLQTAAIRERLPVLLKQLGVASLLDAPCGDCNWMRHVWPALEQYVGIDVVPELIARNQQLYGSSDRRFGVADLTRDRLPACDAILCRDCLIHLPFRDIGRAVRGFRQTGATYLIATNHPWLADASDIEPGMWRPINLHGPPLRFAAPLHRVIENPILGKTLDVWRLTDL